MRESLNYFYSLLKGKSGEELGQIIERVSQNLLFTTIYIGDELNAYKVFETLNARGTQLSSGDLLKNYLFSLIDDGDDTPDGVLDQLETTWEKIGETIGENHYTDYIVCDWNSNHSLIRKTALFRAIRNDITNPEAADNYLNRLAENSQLYAALHNSEDEYWKDCSDYFGENWQLFTTRLGNMALVTQAENKELGQKSFAEKKQILSKSKISFINCIEKEYEQWDSKSVESRQKLMAARAAKIWRID